MSRMRPIELRERGGPTGNAHRTLPRLAAEYFAEVRSLLARDPEPWELHQARLATKRFRYTLELFRPCYGAGFEARMTALRKVQKILGDLNDNVASEALLSRVMERSEQRKQVRRFLQDRAKSEAARFREQWDEFDANGNEQWWKDFLAGRNPRAKNIAKSA